MLPTIHQQERKSFSTRFLRYVVAFIVTCCALTGSAFASVEVNSADTAQLETVKGIGPSLSGKILAARKQGAFKDWSDLSTRVSGVGEKNSAAFSRAGLTVGGKPKDGAPASGEATSAKSTAGKTAAKKPVGDPGATTLASSAKR